MLGMRKSSLMLERWECSNFSKRERDIDLRIEGDSEPGALPNADQPKPLPFRDPGLSSKRTGILMKSTPMRRPFTSRAHCGLVNVIC